MIIADDELSPADNRILEETGLDNTLRHRHPSSSQSMRTTSPQYRRPYFPPTHSGNIVMSQCLPIA